MTWLAAKGALGLVRWGWIAVVAAAVLLALGWLRAAERADDKANQEIGALGAAKAGQDVTLGQIGKANDAGNQIRNGAGTAAYCECLRNSTDDTKRNCVRDLPVELVPGRSGDPLPDCPS